jgi:hypothetical protein
MLDRVIRAGVLAASLPNPEGAWRLRTLGVSTVVMAVAATWMLERIPW